MEYSRFSNDNASISKMIKGNAIVGKSIMNNYNSNTR